MILDDIGEQIDNLFNRFARWVNLDIAIILYDFVILLIALAVFIVFNLLMGCLDFLHLHKILPGNLIAFITGTTLFRITLIVLLIKHVEKSDERPLLKWFKLTELSTIIELVVIGLMSFGCWCIRHYSITTDDIPSNGMPDTPLTTARIAFPMLSYAIIFFFYFHVKYLRFNLQQAWNLGGLI